MFFRKIYDNAVAWLFLSPIQDRPFRGCSGMRGRGAKSSPHLPKTGTVIPYLKRIQKICKSRDKPLEFGWHLQFFNRKFSLNRKIQTKIGFYYLLSNSFHFYWLFKACFNQHDCNFDYVSKISYFRPPWNNSILKKGYVIISVHEITTKILSRDSTYIVNVVM